MGEWDETLTEYLVGEKMCGIGAVGDATTGYLLGHYIDTNELEESDKIDPDTFFNYLYSEESYDLSVPADDGVSTKTTSVHEPTIMKEALDSDKPPAFGGIVIGEKKFRVVQVQELPVKSGENVKALIIALGKLQGCIAIAGGYYVIGILNTSKNEAKSVAVDLSCELANMLATNYS